MQAQLKVVVQVQIKQVNLKLQQMKKQKLLTQLQVM